MQDKRSWTPNQLIFMEWLLTSPKDRKAQGLPLTEQDLADKLGVAPRTLRHWKGQPAFKDDLSRASLMHLWQAMPRIVSASMTNMAKPSGWQERIAYFRYVWPALHKLGEANYFDSVNQADADAKLNPANVADLLAVEDPATREKFLTILDRMQLLESNAPEQNEDEDKPGQPRTLTDLATDPPIDLVPLFAGEDDEDEEADKDEAEQEYQRPRLPAPKKQHQPARSYTKRNVRPLR